MPSKITEQECHNRLISRPITMIYYGGTTHSTQSIFLCKKCGYEWKTKFNSVDIGKKGCKKCSGLLKFTEQECIEKLINRNIEIIFFSGNGYTNSKFKCKICNHIWVTTFSSINHGHGCKKCSGKMKLTINECIKRLENRNIQMIYYAGKTLDKTSIFKCLKCGRIWSTSFSNVATLGRGCSKCVGLLKFTKEDIINKLLNLNKKIELIEYGTSVIDNKSKFKCLVCNNIWQTTFSAIYNNNRGCPKCSKFGFKTTMCAWVYIILIYTKYGSCYGFGVTNNIKNRMKNHIPKLSGMIDYIYPPIYFDSGADALELENKWKKSKYIIRLDIDGFRKECVLVNSETTKMIFG